MVEIKVEDPDLFETKKVDSEGRVYVGKDFAGKEVQLVLVRTGGDDDCEGKRSPAVPATN